MTSRLSRKKLKISDASGEPTKASSSAELSDGASKQSAHTKESDGCAESEMDTSRADFIGGCTQFQHTAARALLKGQQSKKTTKRKDDGKTRGKIIDIKPNPANIESTDSSRVNSDESASDREKERAQGQDEGTRANKELQEGKKCSTCSKVIPTAEFSTHSIQCLRENFARKKTGSKDGMILFCQICDMELSALSDIQRQEHYNRCLDSPPTASTSAVPVPVSDSQPQKHCHVCNKNLAHLNHTRKLQHINKCMDQAEALRKHEEAREKAMEKARNKVLDCPLCGKPLKTQNSRQAHVKKCGRELGVLADQVLARLHQQQQEHANLLSAGILPPEPSRRGRGTSRRPNTGATAIGRANVDRMDPDTALAIALSTSLKDEELRRKRTSLDDFTLPPRVQRTSIEAGGDRVTEDRGDGLSQDAVKDAFSVLMSPTPVEKTKKRKKKKGPQHVPLLLVQTALEAKEKLAQRFADVILQPPTETVAESKTPKLKASAVQRKYTEEESPSKQNPMWKKTSLLNNDTNFYVASLKPHVERCTLNPGSKLKKMNQIPGWNPLEPSPEKPKTANQTMLVSTQTAVLLAELADGNVTTALDQTRVLNQTGWMDLTKGKDGLGEEEEGGKRKKEENSRRKESEYEDQASGFFEESQPQSSTLQNPMVSRLHQDLAGMVGNPLASDVMIRTAADPIPAHSFILAARAPLLYKAVTDGCVDLGTYSPSSVLAVLKFLYSADVTDIPAPVLRDVIHLANRFELQELAAHCSKRVRDLGNDLQHDLDPDLSRNKANDTLQNLLKEMWGSDEDISQEEEEGGKKKEEEEIDELYSFMNSQRTEETEETQDSEESEDEGKEESDVEETCGDFIQDKIASNENHNSRLSSGAIEDLLKEWDKETDSDSSTSKNAVNISGTKTITNKDNNEKIEEDITMESNTPTSPKSDKKSPNKSSSSSPVLIQSESEHELDNSGSDLFESLTPKKTDCEMDTMDTNSPIVNFKDTEVENTEAEGTDVQGTDVFISELNSSSSCSPVFTTQNCRPTRQTQNVSINLVDSDCESPDRNSQLSEASKKRKRDSSKMDSTSTVVTPKRPRQDRATPRKEVSIRERNSPENSRKIPTPNKKEKSPNKMDLTSGNYSQNSQKSNQTAEKSNEAKPKRHVFPDIRQKNTLKRSLEQDFNRASQLQHSDVSDAADVSGASADVSDAVADISDAAADVFDTAADVFDAAADVFDAAADISDAAADVFDTAADVFDAAVNVFDAAADISDAAADVSDAVADVSDAAADVSDAAADDIDTSPVFPRISTSLASIQNSPAQTKSLVDLTQDEDDREDDEEKEDGREKGEEGGREDKETEDTASPASSCPMSQNFDGFSDVFEGYEEPEAYQDLMDVLPTEDVNQLNEMPSPSVKSSDEERLPDLRSVSEINLNEEPTTKTDIPITINSSSEPSPTLEVPEQREENRTDEVYRGEDGIHTQKSRKMKKFNFKSQKSSQCQKPLDTNISKTANNIRYQELKTRDDKKSSESQKQPDIITSKTASNIKSQDHELKINLSQSFNTISKMSKTTSNLGTQEAELRVNLTQSSKTSPTSSQSLTTKQTEPEARFEDTFGSEDEGVLNMVMDEVERVEEFDPPTDISMNVTMDGSFKEPSVHPNLLKTPVALPRMSKTQKKPLSTWQPPSPFTPMPQYDSMKTPDLKKHCTKYGIRALPKKKMVNVLKDVYAQTHQYETDSEYEQPSPSSSKSDQSNASTQPANQKAAKTSKAGKSKSGKEAGKKTKKKQPVEEISDDTGLNESFEEKSSGTDLPEESIVISPTSSPVSKKDMAYKRKQVMDYIQSHDEVYLKILHYEPLEFDAFHQELKSAGVNIGKQLLLELLDEKCVMFSLRGSRKPTKSRKRSPKKSPRKGRGRGRGRGRGGVPSLQSTQS